MLRITLTVDRVPSEPLPKLRLREHLEQAKQAATVRVATLAQTGSLSLAGLAERLNPSNPSVPEEG
ncbi:MAG: hypothetical protein ACYC5M_14740 [Anaerolineae bacterium]